MISQYKCQSCGAALKVDQAFAVIVVCDYCGSSMSLHGNQLSIDGEPSKIKIGHSFLKVGQIGKFEDISFRVQGAVRYHHEVGAWTEWQLLLGTSSVWLQEDEGELVLFTEEKELDQWPDFEKSEIGGKILVDNQKLTVLEKGEAVIAALSGQVGREVRIGQGFFYLDLAADYKIYSLEYFYSGATLSIGREVERSSFKIDF